MNLIMPKMGKCQPPNTAKPEMKYVDGKNPKVVKCNPAAMRSSNAKNIKAHEEV